VVSLDSVLEAHTLASVQKTELTAVTYALQLAAEKLLIYTQTLIMLLPIFMYMGLCIYKKQTKNNLKTSHSVVSSEFRQDWEDESDTKNSGV
jgi:hypothetical protein